MKRSRVVSLIVLWTLPLLASGAYAQAPNHPVLRVQIPFEFVVGHQIFPAGIYTFRSLLHSVPSKSSIEILEVRSTAGHLYSAIVTDLVEATERADHARLEFVRSGGRAFLSEVWEQERSSGCRLTSHNGPELTVEKNSDKVTLVASADYR